MRQIMCLAAVIGFTTIGFMALAITPLFAS